jgi:hypothetical protein
MANTINLDILIVETYSMYALSISDFSTYPNNYTPVSPTIQITPPGFQSVTLDFVPNTINNFSSADLGINFLPSSDPMKLPDGIYKAKYTINPATQYHVEKTWIRVNYLQEMFDSAFMKMDMMECDNAIKKQAKVELDSIYYFIQGAIAAANQCAEKEALKMYNQAQSMLTKFITNKCNCNGYS